MRAGIGIRQELLLSGPHLRGHIAWRANLVLERCDLFKHVESVQVRHIHFHGQLHSGRGTKVRNLHMKALARRRAQQIRHLDVSVNYPLRVQVGQAREDLVHTARCILLGPLHVVEHVLRELPTGHMFEEHPVSSGWRWSRNRRSELAMAMALGARARVDYVLRASYIRLAPNVCWR